MPPSWNHYIEPMAGSAALFFHVVPRKAIVADLNSELINFYGVLRDNPTALIDSLMCLRASKALYSTMRNRRPRSRLESAIRFAYLNRLCWNGLYRVNKAGEFNVPIGDRLPKTLWSAKELHQASRILGFADLVAGDFESTLRRAKQGDFVFLDPPYPRGAPVSSGFNRYCPDFFSHEDHERLGRILQSLDKRGVATMILLASSRAILSCYPKLFHRKRLRSKSLISCDSSSRRLVDECILMNYDIAP